jgi:hypothetical protein
MNRSEGIALAIGFGVEVASISATLASSIPAWATALGIAIGVLLILGGIGMMFMRKRREGNESVSAEATGESQAQNVVDSTVGGDVVGRDKIIQEAPKSEPYGIVTDPIISGNRVLLKVRNTDPDDAHRFRAVLLGVVVNGIEPNAVPANKWIDRTLLLKWAGNSTDAYELIGPEDARELEVGHLESDDSARQLRGFVFDCIDPPVTGGKMRPESQHWVVTFDLRGDVLVAAPQGHPWVA